MTKYPFEKLTNNFAIDLNFIFRQIITFCINLTRCIIKVVVFFFCCHTKWRWASILALPCFVPSTVPVRCQRTYAVWQGEGKGVWLLVPQVRIYVGPGSGLVGARQVGPKKCKIFSGDAYPPPPNFFLLFSAKNFILQKQKKRSGK